MFRRLARSRASRDPRGRLGLVECISEPLSSRPTDNAVANDRRNLVLDGPVGAPSPTQTRRGPPSRAVCASSCLAADCGFRDRCHAQAYSARVLAASRRRAARDGRPAWPATGSRPLRRTLTRVPQKVRLCAAGAACASRLMARGSRPDVHSTPTLDWHPRRGCEGTACVLTRIRMDLR